MFIETSHGLLNVAAVLMFRRFDAETAVAIYRTSGDKLRHALCSAAAVERITKCKLR